MEKEQFAAIRRQLGKTQAQMAQLLGTSSKAIQSFEQGWRNIPAHAERQTLFLLAATMNQKKRSRNCWGLKRCPRERRERCPAWEFQLGKLCWFINGTVCQGEVKQGWQEKMEVCRKCKVFNSIFSNPPTV
jgi:DNA-binding XRE family transcriptional regulator